MFRNKKNWANLITFSRILGVGIIFWLTPYTTNLMALTVVIIYTVVCITDVLDGYIARKYNAVSDLGKIMDPLADKILVLVFLPLVFMHAIDAFPVFLILSREFAIMGVRVFSAKQGIIIAASQWGKFKTAITLPVCGILMARVSVTPLELSVFLQPLEDLRLWIHHWPTWVYDTLIWMMVMVTIGSFIDYLCKFLWSHYLQKAKGDRRAAKKMIYVFIPNTMTLINLVFGIMAGVKAFNHEFQLSVAYIMMGAILDAFDGRIARKLSVYSPLGAKLDTNADFITFGVAPAIFAVTYVSQSGLPFSLWIGMGLGALFYASVHYRLNRYQKGDHTDHFEGLPSPAGAAILVLLGISTMANESPYLFIASCLILSVLMASKIAYPHNRITRHIIIFNRLSKASIVFWFITLGQLAGIPFPPQWHIIDITLLLTASYLVTPWLPKKALK